MFNKEKIIFLNYLLWNDFIMLFFIYENCKNEHSSNIRALNAKKHKIFLHQMFNCLFQNFRYNISLLYYCWNGFEVPLFLFPYIFHFHYVYLLHIVSNAATVLGIKLVYWRCRKTRVVGKELFFRINYFRLCCSKISCIWWIWWILIIPVSFQKTFS